ncbi:uncharacterized protein LOC141590362 [Silene latifolia]|uniref:uncharacterized protein LOC141590362 n=1 Tax=Silene latifolia TaxID=37657 RepID=UPI003D7871BB
MNNPTKQQEIKRSLLLNKVGLCGLLETKIRSSNGNKVRNNLGDHWAICTNSTLHRGGRIWLLWEPTAYDINILDVQTQSIHFQVIDKIRRKQFWMTVVYGLNKAAERIPLWDSLRKYHSMIQGPWIVAGDFNSVMAVNERIGGAPISHAEIRPIFADYSRHAGLSRSRCEGAFSPGITNMSISPKFIADWIGCSSMLIGWIAFQITMFTFYLRECLTIVQVSFTLKKKDKRKGVRLTELSLNHFQHLLVDDPLNKDLCHSERECARNLEDLLKARDQFLRQKAKGDWMQYGDDNTAFFHASIKHRRAKNRVYQVKDVNNHLCSTPETIQKAFEEYYETMLGSSKSVKPLNKRIVKFGNCLTPEHCSLLIAPVTGEEVRLAMFSIPGTKAPGPDGYSSQFFKDNWSVVGADVISCSSAFRCLGSFETV